MSLGVSLKLDFKTSVAFSPSLSNENSPIFLVLSPGSGSIVELVLSKHKTSPTLFLSISAFLEQSKAFFFPFPIPRALTIGVSHSASIAIFRN